MIAIALLANCDESGFGIPADTRRVDVYFSKQQMTVDDTALVQGVAIFSRGVSMAPGGEQPQSWSLTSEDTNVATVVAVPTSQWRSGNVTGVVRGKQPGVAFVDVMVNGTVGRRSIEVVAP
ncbi:MAG TPA: hypothetical protein VJ867_01290 [Gemmatimonadaceae bacterium]|nr:hypothetical protein [Gemmatimonadaceae bacterium]